MSSLTTKILGVGGGLITVAGGVYGAYHFTTKQPKVEKTKVNRAVTIEGTVANLLDKAGYRLLEEDEDVDGKWKERWDKFKQDYSAQEPVSAWSFGNWNTFKNNVQAPKEFRERCTYNSGDTISGTSAPLFEEMKNYCAVAKDS